jgi:phosphoribosylanthranilate isomerase
MRELQIKVCGLKEPRNILEVAMLEPNYIGFVLHRYSKRYISLRNVQDTIKNIPPSIRKVGVIVNESVQSAIKIAHSGAFDLLQLHGNESIDYCRTLSSEIKIIKAFQVSGSLPDKISDYQPFCSLFLFDTAGRKPGGNGKKFDHSILDNYLPETGYLLSGGIGPEDYPYIKTMNKHGLSGIDLNSRFETQPGVKDVGLLKRFIENIHRYDEQN